MTPDYLHLQLMEACKHGNVHDVQTCLDAGADPNFNIKKPANALDTAIHRDHHQIITLLLAHGAIIKEYVLQKAIERDKNYVHLLLPNFQICKDHTLLMGVLQAAINRGDLSLVTQAINQGATPASLVLSAIRNLGNIAILQLLIENGFDIHADNNMILTEWMGSTHVSGWGDKKHERHDLLAFITEYYLDKPNEITKFGSLRLPDKSLLFNLGLSSNHFPMMKFALLIGVDKNEALNSALHRYYAYQQSQRGSTHSALFKNHHSKKLDYEIIAYILHTNLTFKKITISNAVCFQYHEIIDALHSMHDLEYAYEMAYHYENTHLCDLFTQRGVSKEARSVAKMRVSTRKGEIKALGIAINEGANIQALEEDVIIEVINKNQVEMLKYLYDLGVVFDTSLNQHLDEAIRYYNAYDTVSYLIELGFDITKVKNIPLAFKQRYPAIADMWQKSYHNIFDYTIYLAKELYPQLEGKEQEKILQRIAQLSTLPYVVQKSKEQSREH